MQHYLLEANNAMCERECVANDLDSGGKLVERRRGEEAGGGGGLVRIDDEFDNLPALGLAAQPCGCVSIEQAPLPHHTH